MIFYNEVIEMGVKSLSGPMKVKLLKQKIFFCFSLWEQKNVIFIEYESDTFMIGRLHLIVKLF